MEIENNPVSRSRIENLKESFKKAGRSLYNSSPILFGVILLIGLINVAVPKSIYGKIFSKNIVIDLFLGSFIGSILAGNPTTSYILGGEFLKQGVSLLAVTSFLVAWVTVGIVQLPAESVLLGKRFAIWRNITAFFLSIVVAIITVMLLRIL